jgi:hypothetical protein
VLSPLLPLLLAAASAGAAEGKPRELAADVRFLDAAARGDLDRSGRGHEASALYVSARMEAAGLAPAAEGGGWLQAVPLRAWTVDPLGSVLALHGPTLKPPMRLVPDEDFVALSDGDLSEAEIDGPLAFAGYGVSAPEYGYDDLRGVDFKGKIAVVLLGAPSSDRPNFFPPSTRAVYSDPREKMRRLAARGAVGVLLVHTPEAEASLPWSEVARRARLEETGLAEGGRPPTGVDGLAGRARLSPGGFDKLLAAAGVAGGARAMFEKAEANRLSAQEWPLRARLRLRSEIRDAGSSSVLGMLRGTDPVLAGEVVLVTASLDGAGSEAAGVAAMLQVASSLAALPGGTRRSVLFAALAGGAEEGLGAEYLARHPPVERERIVAHLGVDARPALRPFTGVVARGADLSTLAPAVQSAATSVGVAVVVDAERRADAADGADGTAFARQGIPFAFLVPVTQAAAPAAAWDWESLMRLARLETLLVREVAQSDRRPRWTSGNPWGRPPAPAPGSPRSP